MRWGGDPREIVPQASDELVALALHAYGLCRDREPVEQLGAGERAMAGAHVEELEWVDVARALQLGA